MEPSLLWIWDRAHTAYSRYFVHYPCGQHPEHLIPANLVRLTPSMPLPLYTYSSTQDTAWPSACYHLPSCHSIPTMGIGTPFIGLRRKPVHIPPLGGDTVEGEFPHPGASLLLSWAHSQCAWHCLRYYLTSGRPCPPSITLIVNEWLRLAASKRATFIAIYWMTLLFYSVWNQCMIGRHGISWKVEESIDIVSDEGLAAA